MCSDLSRTGVQQIHEAIIKQEEMAVQRFLPRQVGKWYCRDLGPYRLLRVTAVLTARDDGSQALGVKVGDSVRPAEPYLRNPDKHSRPDDNYIRDWMALANLQLLNSGASFGLDLENIRYVLELSNLLHERECGDGKDAETTQFFGNSAYRDSVIFLFRWGSDPAQHSGQGCSGLTSPYILMPGVYRDNVIWVDGELVYGNNHLTHEFGHFMGLGHPFPGLAGKLADLAGMGNPKNFPLAAANLPEMEGVTEQEIHQRRQQARDCIATWPWTLEQDAGSDPPIPAEYGIKDTPVDLGTGLPLIFGDYACRGSHTYTFPRYSASDLKEIKGPDGNVIWWEPESGASPSFEDTVTIDDTVRRNVMSYWGCDPRNQRFSADQVRRMHYVLDRFRSQLVGRTVRRTACLPTWLPILGELVRPPVKPGVIPRFDAWDPANLRRYLERLATEGRLESPSAATRDWLTRSAGEVWGAQTVR